MTDHAHKFRVWEERQSNRQIRSVSVELTCGCTPVSPLDDNEEMRQIKAQLSLFLGRPVKDSGGYGDWRGVRTYDFDVAAGFNRILSRGF